VAIARGVLRKTFSDVPSKERFASPSSAFGTFSPRGRRLSVVAIARGLLREPVTTFPLLFERVALVEYASRGGAEARSRDSQPPNLRVSA
jgi:hypothetical protein